MIHTPLSTHTNTELIMFVNANKDATWAELELSQRLEQLMDAIEDLNEHLAVLNIESGKPYYNLDTEPQGAFV